MEEEIDVNTKIELLDMALTHINDTYVRQRLFDFYYRAAEFKILTQKFNIPIDKSINIAIDKIDKLTPILWEYLNREEKSHDFVESYFSEIFDKEFEEELKEITDQIPSTDNYSEDNIKIKGLDPDYIFKIQVKFVVLSYLVETYIIETLINYSKEIGDKKPLIMLQPKEKSKWRNALARILKGYTLKELNK